MLQLNGDTGASAVQDGSLTAADVAAAAVGSAGIQRMQLFAAKNASGTAVDFSPADGTGIPIWAKKIVMSLAGVSLSGTDHVLAQLGTGGAPTTAGYLATVMALTNAGTVVGASSAAGALLYAGNAAVSLSGMATFTKHSGNTWQCVYCFRQGSTTLIHGACEVTLAGACDMLRLTVTGSNTFDAGSISLLIEG